MLKKLIVPGIIILTLGACIDAQPEGSVALLDSYSSSCANTHMKTDAGLPMRCGPQVAAPYTFK